MASIAEIEKVILRKEDVQLLRLIVACYLFWKTHKKYPNLNYHKPIETPTSVTLSHASEIYTNDTDDLSKFYENELEKLPLKGCSDLVYIEVDISAQENRSLLELYAGLYFTMEAVPCEQTFRELLARRRYVESFFYSSAKIGQGSYGIVYSLNLNGRKFAVKVLEQEDKAEYETLKAVRGKPHFIECFCHTRVRSYDETFMYLYMFNYVAQTLDSIVDKLKPDQQLYVFQQLRDGLKSIHSIGVIHGDIKSLNVVVDEKDNIYFIDFGSSYDFNSSEPYDNIGATYPSPELNALMDANAVKNPLSISKDVFFRSDEFALWVIVDQMVKKGNSIAYKAWKNTDPSIERNDKYINQVTTYLKSVTATPQDETDTNIEILKFWQDGLLRYV